MVDKTVPTTLDVIEFLEPLDGQRKSDALKLVEIMELVSNEKPVMWGSNIIGFGNYHYKYASGREGDWMIIGFSP